jgi:SAM-dependent methyltransferase
LPSEKWYHRQIQYRDSTQQELGHAIINDNVEQYRRLRYKELFAYLKSKQYVTTASVNILDIGCGTGAGLHQLVTDGYSAHGLEIDQSRARYGLELGVHIDIGAWQVLSSLPRNINMILSIHSLEHFYQPFAFLQMVSEYLPTGSLFYLEVPDSSFIKDFTDSLYLSHINNFNKNSLNIMLQRLPFEVLESGATAPIYSKNHDSLYFLLRKDASLNLPTTTSLALSHASHCDLSSALYVKRQYAPPCIETLTIEFDTAYLYTVPSINDLSVTYKKGIDIHETVRLNQAGLKLVLSDDGCTINIL